LQGLYAEEIGGPVDLFFTIIRCGFWRWNFNWLIRLEHFIVTGCWVSAGSEK
jgi:hypothetical protein